MRGYQKRLGDFGEAAAAEYLLRQGYQIVEQNYRCAAGEVDIIAKNDTCLLFVEVKTRTSDRYGTPAEAVTPLKQKRMAQTAMQYLSEPPVTAAVRFDVIEIYAALEHGVFILQSLNHIENAIPEVEI